MKLRNGEAIQTAQRETAKPLKRRQPLNGEALNEVKQRSEKRRSHRNGIAIQT